MDKDLVRILNTICFECASAQNFSLVINGPEHPKPGGRVAQDGTCQGCPIAEIRGAGATISTGRHGKIFTKQLLPGEDCAWPIDELDTWRPCEVCAHAAVTEENGEIQVTLKDLRYCCLNCPAKSMRDSISEAAAEARMS